MPFWTVWAINTALGLVSALAQRAATTPEHRAKLQTFLIAGQDLVNNW